MAKKQKQKKVIFSIIAPDARCVQLAGDFNAWDPNVHFLDKKSDEMWEINLDLSPGRYEYKFLVDGQWYNDPDCSDFAPDPFGGENSVLKLK
jgi:1,4-alpha-glucan branching enzyme